MIPLPAFIDPEAWEGFCEMRKSKGKRIPFTGRAAKLILAELYKLRDAGHDPNAALDQSTKHGWSDVYAPKEKEITKVAAKPVDKTQEYLKAQEEHARLAAQQSKNRQPIKLVRTA